MSLSRVMVWCGVAVMVGIMGPVAVAQPPGGGGGGGGPGFGGRFGGGMGSMMILRNEQIQKELEIVDDQLQELEAIGEEMRDSFQGFRDMSEDERADRMREITADFEKRVNEVLLPHQQKRLKQITAQFQARGREGVTGALTEGNLADELKITEEQREKLRKVGEEARAEMDEKMRKLREEMEQKILAVLTDEQRSQYKELMGEPFEMDMRQMFQGRGGRDGGGGRGGDRNRNDF
jgi:Spy/CpxP family protein refolding chaperone